MVALEILCPDEKVNKTTEVTGANKYFPLPPFNFCKPLHLTAGREGHNHKHCLLRKALDFCWAGNQEQPFELRKAQAKKIIWPPSCHLLKQNKDTTPFGFYIYAAFQNPFLHFHIHVLHRSQSESGFCGLLWRAHNTFSGVTNVNPTLLKLASHSEVMSTFFSPPGRSSTQELLTRPAKRGPHHNPQASLARLQMQACPSPNGSDTSPPCSALPWPLCQSSLSVFFPAVVKITSSWRV